MATGTQTQQLVTVAAREQRIAAFDAFMAAAAEQDRLYHEYQALDVRDYAARDTARWAYLEACDRTLEALAVYQQAKVLCYGSAA